MCPLDTIPYFREIALGIIVLLMIASFFVKEKCNCKKELEALRERVDALEAASSKSES